MMDSDHTVYIIVSGMPGSGKTSLSQQISKAFHATLISKDTIKEALGSAYDGEITLKVSKQLGRMTYEALFAVARESRGVVVLESLWHPKLAIPEFKQLPGHLIEVHCDCEPELARQRYIERAPKRHRVHVDNQHFDDELWTAETSRALGVCPKTIEINTETPVDLDKVLQQIKTHPSWIGS